MALIKCEKVSVGYEGRTVLKDLDFQIDSGDYLCIVGENGSGKSTLVKSILGLKMIEKGRIIFSDGLKQREIGYLPQQTDVQKDFPASVYEVVLSGSCLLYTSYTVEAGRPDSITEKKLQVLRNYPVTRISINPQTMQTKTLKLVGRKHTAEDVTESFYLARKVGFDNINMDLIAGLPGEDANDMKDTLRQIERRCV